MSVWACASNVGAQAHSCVTVACGGGPEAARGGFVAVVWWSECAFKIIVVFRVDSAGSGSSLG